MRFSSVAEVLALIELADQNLQEPETSRAENHEILVNKALTKKLIQELGRLILAPDGEIGYDKDFLINYYKARPEFGVRGLVPSMHIDDGNYVLARLAVDQIVSSSVAESEYLEVQQIYLDYLEGRFGPVSQSSVNRLRVIALKQHSFSGYAHALYYLITGEKIGIDIPDSNNVVERRENSAEIFRDISVFPNPTSDLVNVEVYESESSDYTFSLVGMNGLSMLKEVIASNSKMKIDVSSITPGIYSMSILDAKGAVIFQDRLVIMRK